MTFRQNTGMLVMRQTREWAGCACRACGKSLFYKTSLHTLILGWWGTISMILTPIILVMNVWNVIRVLRLPTAVQVARSALEDQEEYARNLLRTKDRATVVSVLAQSSGAPVGEVESFLDRLAVT